MTTCPSPIARNCDGPMTRVYLSGIRDAVSACRGCVAAATRLGMVERRRKARVVA